MPSSIEEALTRGVSKIYPNKEALEKTLASRKLKMYLGIDATGPDLHLGHSTNLFTLKRFQELGHEVILLIGDFTAMIGDPSDKTATRVRLSRSKVLENAKTYKQQASKILSFAGRNPAKLMSNSEWLSKLSLGDVIELAANITVQQLIERDLFQERLKKGGEIYLHEFIYPLLQGYDSVVMGVDLELGGTDQTFNMLAGRQLMKKLKNREKFVLTTELLINPKTKKKLMSKSEGTYVALNDKPTDMFGKVMALPDEVIINCFEFCTEVPMAKIRQLSKEIKKDPMSAKKQLAYEITKIYHGEKKATATQEEFARVIQKGEEPKRIPSVLYDISLHGSTPTISTLTTVSGLVSSVSEGQRIIRQGGVEINHQKPLDPQKTMNIMVGEEKIIKVGKRGYRKIKATKGRGK